MKVEDAAAFAKKVEASKVDFEDMLGQTKMVARMGSISAVTKLIPGMSKVRGGEAMKDGWIGMGWLGGGIWTRKSSAEGKENDVMKAPHSPFYKKLFNLLLSAKQMRTMRGGSMDAVCEHTIVSRRKGSTWLSNLQKEGCEIVIPILRRFITMTE